MDQLLHDFEISINRPEDYLDGSAELRKACLNLSKEVFNCCYDKTGRFPTGPLCSLLTEGFDNDQIWEQIQLLNEPTIKYAKNKIKEVANMKIISVDESQSMHGNEAEQLSYHGESDEEIKDSIESEECVSDLFTDNSKKPKGKHDLFFNLSDMNRFLQDEDRKYEKRLDGNIGKLNSGSDVDLFRELSSGEEDEHLKYDDFFDPPNDNHDLHHHDQDSDNVEEGSSDEIMEESINQQSYNDDEDDIEDGHLSSHQKQQQKLKKLIRSLEDESVAEKPWQLTGEVTSQHRPVNSLLEEVFSFDHMTRTAPSITEETTKNLEDIIKQRIIDEAWDDVVRKVKPAEKPFDYSRARPLDQEKSSLSLAEVYEQEFLKQKQADSEEKEDKRHTEIKEMMVKLFHKLDALSNFHFTPKPPKPDVKVVVNVPSLTIEEVTPSFQSDANLLAPEEIQGKSKAQDDIGETEKTKTDKLRARRKKKKRVKMLVKSKASRQKLVSQLNIGLGNKFSKRATLKELDLASRSTDFSDKADRLDKRLKSSKSFFEHLQDEVTTSVKSSRTVTKRKPKHTKSSSFLKL